MSGVEGMERRGRGRSRIGRGVVAVMAIAVAACSVAPGASDAEYVGGASAPAGLPTPLVSTPTSDTAIPTPSASTAPSIPATPVPSIPPSPFRQASASPTATDAVATPDPSPAETQSPTVEHSGALPNVGMAPAGGWTSIEWVAGGRVPAPALDLDGENDFFAASWSGGYVAFWSLAPFEPSDTTVSRIYVTTSRDGLRWTQPSQIPSNGWTGIAGVAEANGVLLAEGRTMGGICGAIPLTAFWTTRDGATWTKADLAPAFGAKNVYSITSGGAGFIAQGGPDSGNSIWTSIDGSHWSPRTLPIGFTLSNAVSFSSGFVLAGTTTADLTGGCVSNDETKYLPAAYWSPDGASWTKAVLPGAVAAVNTYSNVCKISDHAILVQAHSFSATRSYAWTSTDGQTWVTRTDKALLEGTVYSDGVHAVATYDNKLFYVDRQLRVTQLAQRGDIPGSGWTALGGTGLLIADYQGYVWLGIPTAA